MDWDDAGVAAQLLDSIERAFPARYRHMGRQLVSLALGALHHQRINTICREVGVVNRRGAAQVAAAYQCEVYLPRLRMRLLEPAQQRTLDGIMLLAQGRVDEARRLMHGVQAALAAA